MNKIYLKKWRLQPTPQSSSKIPENISFPDRGLEVNIPGDIYMHLTDANLIDDPFYADNELRLAWIAECDWEYTTDVDIENTSNVDTIIFDGLDTIADIYLNENFIDQSNNMFIRHTFPVRDYLAPGTNTLKVIFRSPLKMALEKKTDIRQLPSARHKDRVFIRKAQYSFGWDWGPAYPSTGIWKDVYLKQSQIEINHIEFETLSLANSKADVCVKVIFNNTQNENLSVRIRLFDQDQEFKETIFTDGMQKISCRLTIENARLWWPHNLGDPHLYDLEITVNNQNNKEICSYNKKAGIRTVELKLQENGKNCFRFYINDKALFLKGANWIPADSFLPRVTEEKYESLILAARHANMNVLRVWGGGIYENDFFYDICDREGIMVWQDFMFACATYPDDDKFLACAIAGKSKLIVSGDKHLLRVSGYRGIKVERPREFIDEYLG